MFGNFGQVSANVRKPLLNLGITTAMSLMLVHCLPTTKPSGATIKSVAVGEANLWKQANLVACFDQSKYRVTPETDSYEKAIAAAVYVSYNAATTAISVTGLQPCDGGKNKPDFTIFFNDRVESSGTNVISAVASHNGTKGEANSTPYVSVTPSALHTPAMTVTLEQVLVQTTLHEIGHILGLHHEADHAKSTCNLKQSDADYQGEVAIYGYSDYGMPYDPYSIMNYCGSKAAFGLPNEKDKPGYDPAIDPSRVALGLSAGDMAVLTKLYGGVLAKALEAQAAITGPSQHAVME